MYEIITLDVLNKKLASSPHKWELIYESTVKETLSFTHLSVYAAGHILLSVMSEFGSEILDGLSIYAFHRGNRTFSYDAQLHQVQADQVAAAFEANVRPVLTDAYFADDYIDTDDAYSLFRCFSLGGVWASDNEKLPKVLDLLSGFPSNVRERFSLTIDALQDIRASRVDTTSFKDGALLMGSDLKPLRFFGVKDVNGDFILRSCGLSDCNTVSAEKLAEYQEVDGMPFLMEILESFYFFFDKSVITSIAPIVGADGSQLNEMLQCVDLFTEYKESRKKVIVNKSGIGNYEILFTNSVCPWRASFDNLLFGLYFNHNGTESPEMKGLFNPFYLKCCFGVLNNFFNTVYDTFYAEIEQLDLKLVFRKISKFWVYVSDTIRKQVDDVKFSDLTENPVFKELQDLEGYQMVDFGSDKTEKVSGFKRMSVFDQQKEEVLKLFDEFPFSAKKSRITEYDSGIDAIMKLSDSVPGTILALTNLMGAAALVQPADPIIAMLGFDSLGLYGSELYEFLIVCCGNSIKNFRLIDLNHSHGNVSDKEIFEYVKKSKPFWDEDFNTELSGLKGWSAFRGCWTDESDKAFDPDKPVSKTVPKDWELGKQKSSKADSFSPGAGSLGKTKNAFNSVSAPKKSNRTSPFSSLLKGLK